MAVPAHIIAAIQADLGRGRQEELPLSNRDERGRSFIPPQVDESQNYDHRIKQHLNNKWSTAIVDEESRQMQGLTNLNARPWASSGWQAPSLFVIPQVTPPVAPKPAAARPVAPPAPAPPKTTPAAPSKPAKNMVLDTGKCHVSMHEGQTIVPDAKFCVAVSVQNDAAFFMLTAPGKPPVCLNVLQLEVPIIYGTSCIIKTQPTSTSPQNYTIKPVAPSTAEKLARVLENIQIALRKALKLSPLPKPQPAPPTPQVVKVAPAKAPTAACGPPTSSKSLICADSPESSPEPSPHFTKSQLVEVVAKNTNGKPTVKLDDVISSISGIVRTAYYQITGCSAPIIAPDEQSTDAAMAEWLKKGHLDSDADETKRGLMEILRFLREFQLKKSAARAPLMCSRTMEALKTIDRSIRNQGGSASYSASEIMELRKEAVVPTQINVPQEIRVAEMKMSTESRMATETSMPTEAKVSTEIKTSLEIKTSPEIRVKKGLSSSRWA